MGVHVTSVARRGVDKNGNRNEKSYFSSFLQKVKCTPNAVLLRQICIIVKVMLETTYTAFALSIERSTRCL